MGTGVKQPKLEADYSTTSRAEVKNEWSYTSTHPMYLHGVDKDNFTFYQNDGNVGEVNERRTGTQTKCGTEIRNKWGQMKYGK
jgi:hypothetical protein